MDILHKLPEPGKGVRDYVKAADFGKSRFKSISPTTLGIIRQVLCVINMMQVGMTLTTG